MSLSVHIVNKKKYILILGTGPTQRLDDTTLWTEAQYSINLSRSKRKFYLSLHYNGSNRFLFVNATKTYQFKAKYSEIKKYPSCLGNVSGDFLANNMKKTALNGRFTIFLLIIRLVTGDTSDFIDIHKYLNKKHKIK